MSRCSWGRTIFNGPVTVISSGQNSPECSYLEAVCGVCKDQPATLKVYKESTPNNKDLIQEISFTCVKHVDYVKERYGRIIVIKMFEGNDNFSFYAESVAATTKWFRYCGLLFSIPCYVIPNIPEENLVSQCFIDECDDPEKFNAICAWVVYIINEGIALENTTLTGLCIITIRSSDATFNIHNFHTGKHLLSWKRAAIRKSGCIKSLVFLEAGRKCAGGPGLLWMQHPIPKAKELQQCLHDFLFYGPDGISQPRVSTHIACDSAMIKSYHKGCGRESMQANDESQHVDLPCTSSWLLKQSPSLQALKDTSGLSQSSTASSGYCSDTSQCDPSREDFQSSTTKVIQQQGSCKHHSSLDRNRKGSNNTNNDGTATPSINTSKHSTGQMYENCFVRASSSKQYENFSPLNPLLTPPLPPRSVKKTPLYENQPPVLSNPKTSPEHPSNNCSSTSTVDCSTQTQSTCEPVSPTTEKLSRSLSGGSSPPPMPSKHQLERLAFQKCSTKMVDSLSIATIQPYLMDQGLLTQRDIEIMMHRYMTNHEKIIHLISELPRKGDGFFEKFMLCLCNSKSGTGHNDIIRSLTVSLNEVKIVHSKGAEKMPEQTTAS